MESVFYMKRYRILLSILLAVIISMPAGGFAETTDEDSTAVGFSTVEELQEALSLNEPVELVFEGSSLDLDSSVRIATDGITIDLNGGTVNSSVEYPFSIQASDVSIRNGTVNNGGIAVYADNSNGSLEGLVLNDAPDNAIYVSSSGSLGEIYGNTISSSGSYSIHIYQGTVTGNISGNIITDSGSVAIQNNRGLVSGSIEGNLIEGCDAGSYGAINLNGGAEVTAGIIGNEIKNPSGMGIRLYSTSVCGDIDSNIITGSGDHAIQLTGSSSASSNDGCTAEDIINNTISSCRGHGISVYQGSHCGRISGNTLSNIGGAHNSAGDYGIIVSSRTPYKTYASEITHNVIDRVTSSGIVVFSGPDKDTTGKWQDIGCITGDIAYNTVKNAPYKNISNKVRSSIYIDNHARVYGDIHDNVVQNSIFDGISVISYSYVRSIYKNKIIGAKICGLAVKDSAVVTGNIYGNTITSAKEQGVLVNNKAAVRGSIYSNTISGAGINGIFVANSARVNIIDRNSIVKPGKYGVIAGNKGSITQISNNSIVVNSMKSGMGILSNTKCLISKITGNKITGKYQTGIRIKSPTGKVTIKNNTLKNSNKKGKRSTGISCEKAKKLTVTGNKITGNKTATGIYLKKCKGSVKKNSIKKCSSKISKS